jgi:ABC-type cobalamin transport system permease subunit
MGIRFLSSLLENHAMREAELTLPEIGLIAVTRGMLGAGVALLLGDLLPENQRKTVGWTLAAIGAITTIPLSLTVLTRSHRLTPIDDGRHRGHRPRFDSDSHRDWEAMAQEA